MTPEMGSPPYPHFMRGLGFTSHHRHHELCQVVAVPSKLTAVAMSFNGTKSGRGQGQPVQ
jgi:hypothetical protein